ncbi:LAMI_0H12134g1_1 [Lachancea mirantina]|uniref:LAMI_0H12134g1_1 n=1 Tax=Lachancea mirantina TaxID=1230905 RepID=A0A1G4KHP6_9SACH|nr:LAMI_0H12134g1_1 [Lachancea mirantina]
MDVPQKYINFSQLLSGIIETNEGVDQLNEVVVSFLYHLFPKELFVRALSLLESSNMFIYVLENKTCDEHGSKQVDNTNGSRVSASLLISEANLVPSGNDSSRTEQRHLWELLYETEQLQHKLIVENEDSVGGTPVVTDLDRWFCSCSEYITLFGDELQQDDDERPLACKLVQEIDKTEGAHDKFARIKQQQRYFRHDKIMCPHLLAFSILLQTEPKTLRYFTGTRQTVYLIRVQNIDEWLRLHLNIVV